MMTQDSCDVELSKFRARRSPEWWGLKRKWLLFLYHIQRNSGFDFGLTKAANIIEFSRMRAEREMQPWPSLTAINAGIDEWCDLAVDRVLEEHRRLTWLYRLQYRIKEWRFRIRQFVLSFTSPW